jgi:hypothetical protein
MSYYINNANTLTLTLRYVEDRGFEVISIESSGFTNLGLGDTQLAELEIKWQAESTAAIANLKFEGEFVPDEVKSTLPLKKISDRHYEIKYDSIPLSADLCVDEKCSFTLKMPESGSTSMSKPPVRGTSEGGALRAVGVTRPRPDHLAGTQHGVTPSTPTVKLVLLPTRKTSNPTSVRPKRLPRERATP